MLEWGNPFPEASPPSGTAFQDVQHKLKNVLKIYHTDEAFAALLADGSIVCWGDGSAADPSESVYELLVNVQSIHSTSGAFAAVVGTGIDSSVITWGRDDHGGDSSSVKHLLKNVLMVKGNALAFAALRGK